MLPHLRPPLLLLVLIAILAVPFFSAAAATPPPGESAAYPTPASLPDAESQPLPLWVWFLAALGIIAVDAVLKARLKEKKTHETDPPGNP